MPRRRAMFSEAQLRAAERTLDAQLTKAAAATYRSGRCPHCPGHIVGDEARGAISHSEPVCRTFESAMTGPGRADKLYPHLGVIGPDLERMKAEAAARDDDERN